MSKTLVALLALAVSLVVVACGGAPSVPTPPEVPGAAGMPSGVPGVPSGIPSGMPAAPTPPAAP